MWILNSEPEGPTHYLISSKKYVVGRKNCDILLPNDQSISRAHALFTSTDQALTLTDTSKYGTFVNGQRLPENQAHSLKSGDAITFGVFHSKFSVDCQKVVVCSSCVANEGKAVLSQALLPLGGKLVNSWSEDCTHLVMPAVKVTVKTISALLCCRPIVKQEFFTEFSKALQQNLPPPKPERFFPEIDEPSLNKEDIDLKGRPERKRLFHGKTFVFLSAKQLKRLSSAVTLGGGQSQLLEEGSVPRTLLESPQSCVVDLWTGCSQPLLPASTKEWTEALRKVLQEKGLRFIQESEIGLAAIYASSDKHCNPSSLMTDSASMRTTKPMIPSGTLTQNAAVDETVLPGPSLNITAYAVNTETSQRMNHREITGITSVGETPEKNQNRPTGTLSRSKPTATEMATTSTVAETLRLSLNTAQNTDSQKKKTPDPQRHGQTSGNSILPAVPAARGDVKAFPLRPSPQKQKFSPTGSPQKQSSLTSFFQPLSKKRPLEDESSTFQSEPKRAAVLPSSTAPGQATTFTTKQTPAQTSSRALPPVRNQSQLGSGMDLFPGQSDAVSNGVSLPAQQGPHSGKRKQMDADMDMDELESIMSLEMDDLDEQTPGNQGQRLPSVGHTSTNQNQPLDVMGPSSSKRLRGNPGEHSGAKPALDRVETSVATRNERRDTADNNSSVKRQLMTTESRTAGRTSNTNAKKGSSGSKSKHSQDVKDEEVSFVVDSEPLTGDLDQPNGALETPLKPAVKHEASVSNTRDDLPKKLLVVEFKSLTVTAPLKAKLQQIQGNASTKNFKRFRKVLVPGAEGLPNIIGGSDLLAHNRAKNAELDEWLRDVAEEDRQAKRDESLGDDLFRYNPNKQSRRRR